MTFTGKIVGAEMCPGDRTLIHVEVAGYHPIQMSGECVLTIGAPSTPAPATWDPPCARCGRLRHHHPSHPACRVWTAPSPVHPPCCSHHGPGCPDPQPYPAPSPVEEPRACPDCHGDGMQPHEGCDGCLACDGPCPRCKGTGLRAPVEPSTDGAGGGT